MNNLDIQYFFQFDNNEQLAYPLQFNEKKMELISLKENVLPKWTDLEFHQCQHCPLDSSKIKSCPVATNLIPFIKLCGDLNSYKSVDVEVRTSERIYSIKNTTTQRAFSSLLGLIIASSPCPHVNFFKPMARFHIPLANDKETLYRAIGSYLLMQYFKAKSSQTIDLELEGLKQIYKDIQIVNSSMAIRLREAGRNDAPINSIILLDLFAKEITYSIDEALQELEYLYKNLINIT